MMNIRAALLQQKDSRAFHSKTPKIATLNSIDSICNAPFFKHCNTQTILPRTNSRMISRIIKTKVRVSCLLLVDACIWKRSVNPMQTLSTNLPIRWVHRQPNLSNFTAPFRLSHFLLLNSFSSCCVSNPTGKCEQRYR